MTHRSVNLPSRLSEDHIQRGSRRGGSKARHLPVERALTTELATVWLADEGRGLAPAEAEDAPWPSVPAVLAPAGRGREGWCTRPSYPAGRGCRGPRQWGWGWVQSSPLSPCAVVLEGRGGTAVDTLGRTTPSPSHSARSR